MRLLFTFITIVTSLATVHSQNFVEDLIKGDECLETGDFRCAIITYTKILEEHPHAGSIVYHSRGRAKTRMGDYRGAISDYSESIRITPTFDRSWHERAYSKAMLGHHKDAITDYNKAIELNPTDGIYFFGRGHSKGRLGDLRGEVYDYSKAIELGTENGVAHIYLVRGYAKIKLGQKDSGCFDLSKAGELGDPRAYDWIKDLCN